MNPIQKLTEYFSEFPGIGPRQAKRFVYYLLTRHQSHIDEIARLLTTLKSQVHICTSCYRFFQSENPQVSLCEICRNPNREDALLVIVSRDVDLENIERAHVHNGKYFVLGGGVPILEKEPEKRIRTRELEQTVRNRAEKGTLKEIILALNATPEGENTSDFVESYLKSITEQHSIKISHLGRGISTGTELEYSDADTIKNALQNRS
ncbi:MAG: recR [Candidatus Paceibacter sp.]|jgi:recombination protein RecR|nr:recR [Candidatus Paceibacter sp.]